MIRHSALFAATVALSIAPARAETLIAAVSPEKVAVTSNFSGTELTVYGTVERDATTVARVSGYDVAVVLGGPRRAMVTRRKDRILGLWANRDWRSFNAPSFYALATTRAVADLAPPAQRKERQIGIDQLLLPETGPAGVAPGDDGGEFRSAFLDHQRRAGLYAEYPGAVKLLGSHLFSATLPIPAEVPVGRYAVRVLVISDGSPVAEQTVGVEISKSGFEQQVADLAAHRSVVYGLASVVISLLTGWLGGVLFRRD